MEIKFKILGKPRGKQRPRMCIRFGKQITYTPKQTSEYEKLVKASYKDNIVSLRYKNSISNYISSMQLAVSFKEQLINDGYKEILKSSSKCIYENGKYQIVIMEEFDYLIVMMVVL